MGRITPPQLSQARASGAFASVDAFRFTKPYGPAQAVLAGARSGRVSQTLVCLSDSTANTDNEWFGLLGAWLGDQVPAYGSALFATFDDGAQAYGTPTVLATSDGSGPVVLSDSFNRADGAAGQADSSDGSGQQVWSGGFVVSNQFQPTGSSTAPGVISTFAPDVHVSLVLYPAAAGDIRCWFHATDPANAVFVQFTNTAVNIYERVGSTNTLLASQAVTLTSGDNYAAQVLFAGPHVSATVNGVTVTADVPVADFALMTPADDALGFSRSQWSVDDLVVRAAPTVVLLNGAVGGKAPSYYYDETRFPKVVPWVPDLVLISHSHNLQGDRDVDEIDTLVSKVQTDYPGTSLVLSTQNPETTNRGEPWHEQAHAARQPLIRAYAAANGYGLIDAHARFLNDQPALDETTYMLGDGTHPKAAGSAAWFDEAKRVFGEAT